MTIRIFFYENHNKRIINSNPVNVNFQKKGSDLAFI